MHLWIKLLQCPGLGIATLNRLSKHLNSYLDLFSLSETALLAMGLNQSQIRFLQEPDDNESKAVIDYLEQHKIRLISIESSDYPRQLKETSQPPIVLFAKGNEALLQQNQIAVVGSRTPTSYGMEVTDYLVSDLVKLGFVITSGLALGIDAKAHDSALRNMGSTIAVMGTGHAKVYPKRHHYLADSILDKGGLIVSEFLPFIGPQPYNFPRRNRVIAGLSLGTLVVEAAVRSGSLITAEYALDENRDVFAVPGNIFSETTSGTHKLLQTGAKLVSKSADIIEEYEGMNVLLNKNVSNLSTLTNLLKNNLAESKLLASVEYEATPVDVISERSGLPVEQALIELLDLEIQGVIQAVPGGYMKVFSNTNNK